MALPSPINPISYIIQREYTKPESIKSDLFKKRLASARNLYRKDLLSHYGCVNAIEFSNEGELLISGGDDRRVLLWSVPHAILNQGKPVVMQTSHLSNIFCLGFDSTNSRIFSAGNDDQVIVHDSRTGNALTNFPHEKPVYGLSVNPQNDCVFASAGEDGRILIYDIREPSSAEPLCLARYKTAFHAVMFNPVDPRFVATANTEEGIALWDNRKPKTVVMQYGGSNRQNSGMSVRFNALGTQVLALRRRLPPILYKIHSEKPVCQFYHPDYYNSCTMKSCCFAGKNDEYVLSGSDDFNLYMWRIPKNNEWGSIHMVLVGHRSIVNQVRYNRQNNIIASSGVEKMVKLWSPLSIGGWKGSLLNDISDKPRQVYSHEEYISLVQNNGQLVSHDYSHQSTQEDSRMMAFFDSLVQREIEGWVMSEDTVTSDSDYDSSSNTNMMPQLPSDAHRTLSSDKKENRIAQLIFEKRKKLAKMAQQKSSSSSHKYKSREKQRKRKSIKSKSSCLKLSSKSSNSTASSSHSSSRKSQKHSHKWPSSSSSSHPTSNEPKPKPPQKHKYKTRYNTAREREESQNSESLDMPSTSTGITASTSSVYRIYEQDSEDEQPTEPRPPSEPSEQPLINILPTPLNGTHDMYINILQVPVSNGNNVITVRNENANYDNSFNTDSSSDEVEEASTPNSKYNSHEAMTPDSGIVTGPCSSSGSVNSVYNVPCSSNSNNRHRKLDEGSDENDWVYSNFKKLLNRACWNFENNYGGDSDSN